MGAYVNAALLCAMKLSYGEWSMCKQAQTSKMGNSCRTSKGLTRLTRLLRSAELESAEAWDGAARCQQQAKLHVLPTTCSIMDAAQKPTSTPFAAVAFRSCCFACSVNSASSLSSASIWIKPASWSSSSSDSMLSSSASLRALRLRASQSLPSCHTTKSRIVTMLILHSNLWRYTRAADMVSSIHNTTRHVRHMTQDDTGWHGMAWHGMAWHGMAWHGMT